MFAVAEAHVNYRKPARLDDELLITCVPVPEGRASIRFRQTIHRVQEGRAATLLAEGEVRVVCVDAKSFRPRPLPDFIQAREGSAMDNELSIVRLVLNASIPVQVVMGLLLLASLMSWTIIFRKRSLLSRAHDEAENFEDSFWKGGDLTALYRQIESRGGATGMSSIFEFGFREFARLKQGGIPAGPVAGRRAPRDARGPAQGTRAHGGEPGESRHHRLDQSLRGLVRHGVGHHEFLRGAGRRAAGDAAMVAPGIAEALIATAIGLFAAIPAVIAYNRYADQVSRLELRYDAFMEEFSTILQRYAGRGA